VNELVGRINGKFGKSQSHYRVHFDPG